MIGGSTTYTIVASNSGPSNAPGSSVNDTFPAFCVSPSWSCVGAGGGTCTASGSGNIATSNNNLPAGGSVTYTAICPISAGASGTLVNTATVATAGGVNDSVPGNNSATDSDTLAPPPQVTVTPTSIAVNEAGPTSQSVVVALDQAPPSNVTIALTFDANVEVNAGAGFGASPQTPAE